MQSHKIINRISRRRIPIVIIITIFSILLAIQYSVERINYPPISHALSSAERSVKVVWTKDDLSDQMITYEGLLFAVTSSMDKLVGYDLVTGVMLWGTNRPNGRPGARGLIAFENKIFVINSVAVDAYNAKSGELLWTAFLGDGHVSVIPQIESGMLRIYYGDRIFEIDPKTGEVVSKTSRENLLWMIRSLSIRNLGNCQIEARNEETHKVIWNRCDVLLVDEGILPQEVTDQTLIVNTNEGWICSLNLENGLHNWCNEEMYLSNAAINLEANRVYALREDFRLVSMDLITGSILNEINFTTTENDAYAYGRVLYNEGIAIVYFSDSGQTFAMSAE